MWYMRPVPIFDLLPVTAEGKNIEHVGLAIDMGDRMGIQNCPINAEEAQELIELFSTIELSYRGRYKWIEYVDGFPIITVVISNASRFDLNITRDGKMYFDEKRYEIVGDGTEVYEYLLHMSGKEKEMA